MISVERLGLLGLGLRAGHLVVGTGGVRDALRRGEIELVVIAGDRSERTDEKVGRLARARGIPLIEGPPASELGRRLGRDAVQVVGVRDPSLAAGIRGETEAQDH